MKRGVPLKKTWLILLSVLLLFIGCREKAVPVQNEDDGRLRLDEEHVIDFYHDDADPITAQCLAILGDSKPELVKEQDWAPGSVAYTYHVNGAEIRILEYGEGSDREKVLLDVELGENHALQSGVRVGSTEAELKKAYEGKPEFDFHGYDVDKDLRVYVLYGPWYEKYLILFEVDPAAGRIQAMDYELDI